MRKGNSGRKPLLNSEQEEKIIDICSKQRNDFHVVSLRWTSEKISKEFSIKVSLAYVHKLFKKYNWRSVRVQTQHPDQVNNVVEILIINFFNYLWDFIIQNKISPSQFHIMDETGLYSNAIPKVTYAPKGQGGFCVTSGDSVKYTAVVTLSANNSGHLFFVPTLNTETKKINGENVIFRKRSGIGLPEMVEWCKSFLKYASPGDLLIMDNLSAHKNWLVKSILRNNHINFEFFPVRCAFILSVLDNAFFAVFKNNLSYSDELTQDKREKIKKVFVDMIRRRLASAFFGHCKYDKIFATATYPLEERISSSVVTEIPERDENYGKFELPVERSVESILGYNCCIYDSLRCSASCILFFINESEYMQLILSLADNSLCHTVLEVIKSIKNTKVLQLKKQKAYFYDILEHQGFTNFENPAQNAYELLDEILESSNYQLTIDTFNNKEEMTQSYIRCITLNNVSSLEYGLNEYFNTACSNDNKVRVLHTTNKYNGSLPQCLIFKVQNCDQTQQIKYPEVLDLQLFNLLGIECYYDLYAIFTENKYNEKYAMTLYIKVKDEWIGFNTKPFLTDSNHVMNRLCADIGYGRAYILIYQKSIKESQGKSNIPIYTRECFINWKPKKNIYTIPIISKKQIYPTGLRQRIDQRLNDIILERSKSFLSSQQDPHVFPIPDINFLDSNKVNVDANIIQSSSSDEYTDIDNHESVNIVDENGKCINSSSEEESCEEVLQEEKHQEEKFQEEEFQEEESLAERQNDIIISKDNRINKIMTHNQSSYESLCDEAFIAHKYKYNEQNYSNSFCGLLNRGNYCYINTTLHLLSLIPEIEELFEIGYENALLLAIHKVIKLMKIESNEPIDTSIYFDSETYNHQTDIHEFLTHVIDLMQYKTIAEEENNEKGTFTKDIDKLFRVKCETKNDGDPCFDQLIINMIIIDFNSVVAALNNIFEKQKVTFLPKYMILHLNRTRYNTINQSTCKIYKRVLIDKVFTMQDKTYKLKAIIAHIGFESGHYVIYIKDKSGAWVCCNDAKIILVTDREVDELIEGDDYVDRARYIDNPSDRIIDIAASIRTATVLLYELQNSIH